MRNGALNDPTFGSRMRGNGFVAEQIHRMFEVACSRHGLARKAPDLSVSAFRRIEKGQAELF
jgi:hypothetical protein